MRLAETRSGGTELTYDADASVGGAIGGVGQRMLSGVTRKMAGQFFAALDADIAGGPEERRQRSSLRAPASAAAGSAQRPLPRAAPQPRGPSPAGPPHRPQLSLGRSRGFALGVVAGGVIALLGVALGARLGRRR